MHSSLLYATILMQTEKLFQTKVPIFYEIESYDLLIVIFETCKKYFGFQTIVIMQFSIKVIH
jgi:hypothetical protein